MADLADSLRAEADRVMDEVADFIFTRSQENIIKNGSIDTGFMLRSGNINRSFLNKEIIYSAPYSISIEMGSPPHSVSVDHIRKWAQRKLHLPFKKAKSAAYAISNKIAKKGTEPKPFMRPAIDAAVSRYSR